MWPCGQPTNITPDQAARIRATIEGTDYYNLRQWIRFFLLEDFVGELAVPVPRVIQGIKYFTFGEAIDTTRRDFGAWLEGEVEAAYGG